MKHLFNPSSSSEFVITDYFVANQVEDLERPGSYKTIPALHDGSGFVLGKNRISEIYWLRERKNSCGGLTGIIDKVYLSKYDILALAKRIEEIESETAIGEEPCDPFLD